MSKIPEPVMTQLLENQRLMQVALENLIKVLEDLDKRVTDLEHRTDRTEAFTRPIGCGL